jgi:hypothetical protein
LSFQHVGAPDQPAQALIRRNRDRLLQIRRQAPNFSHGAAAGGHFILGLRLFPAP